MARSRLFTSSRRKSVPILVLVIVATLFGGLARGVHAQPLDLRHLSGSRGARGVVDAAGPSARFAYPAAIAADPAGNLYVADSDASVVRKVTAAGEVFTVAGLAGQAGYADGLGASARFNQPWGIAIDSAGWLYVSDAGNSVIRKISSNGVVSTLAGRPGSNGTEDGFGPAARFEEPVGLAVDPAGNVYVADAGSHRIRKVTPTGSVTTLAGSSEGFADGTGSAAAFDWPWDVAVDGSGSVLVADAYNNRIRRVTPEGVVTTLAGIDYGWNDGPIAEALFALPAGVEVDSAGNIWVTDSDNAVIRKIDTDGTVSTVAGILWGWGSFDGPADQASLGYLPELAAGPAGEVFIADGDAGRIRKLAGGVVTTIAGRTAESGYVDGDAATSRYGSLGAVAPDGAGGWWVADGIVIRHVDALGTSVTVAGDPNDSGSDDGAGSSARFAGVGGLSLGPDGNLYLADTGNHTVRKMTPAGVVTTIAGEPGVSGTNDGFGRGAHFRTPVGIAATAAGLFVADTNNHTIRRVAWDGTTVTLAGRPGLYGSTDGSGPLAQFHSPAALALLAGGDLVVADRDNHSIRRMTPLGVVSTIAGGAEYWQGGAADGTGPWAKFHSPTALAVAPDGAILVADSGNDAIRRVTTAGVVTTVLGKLLVPGDSEGTGNAARLTRPVGVAADSSGNVLVADAGNYALWLARPALPDAATATPANGCSGNSVQLGVLPNNGSAWSWSFVRRPAGTSATLSSTTVPDPQLVPDVDDLFVLAADVSGAGGGSRTEVEIRPGTNLVGPADQIACPGEPASFSVTSPGALGYQWFHDGAPIPGATSATLAIASVTAAAAGSYRVDVSTPCGIVSSGEARLEVPQTPLLRTQPVGKAVCAGGTVTLSVEAENAELYRWRRDGTVVQEGWSPSVTLSPSSAEAWTCEVVGHCGLVVSEPAVVLVLPTPSISVSPYSAKACVGESVTFTASLSGYGPESLQWIHNGTAIPGATAPQLVIASVAPADDGWYVCAATIGGCTRYSYARTLTVRAGPPTIRELTKPVAVCGGDSVQFVVYADGADGYQWFHDGVAIAGQTSYYLSIWLVSAVDAGNYTVVVSNCVSATSETTSITVGANRPVITAQPTRQSVCAGESATLTVGATGATSYQWKKSGTPIPGATSASYTIASAAPSDSGNYTCVVGNGACAVETNGYSGWLRVTSSLPTIYQQPSSVVVSANTSNQFQIGAYDAEAWQWRKDGVDLPGKTSPYLPIYSPTPADQGVYSCVVRNGCGSVVSAGATLVVLGNGPTITGSPTSLSRCAGSSASFTVTATGATGYQWKKGYGAIPGANSPTLTIPAVAAADAGYYSCDVTNGAGISTAWASLAVSTAPPVIVEDPSPSLACSGSTIYLRVQADPSATSWQWTKNGIPISGAGSSSLYLSNSTPADSGLYACRVSNTCGTTTSAAATVSVAPRPQITTQPVSQHACLGSPASISVVATGVDSYQWRKDGVAIPGATSPVLSTPGAQPSDEGSYSCDLATGDCVVSTLAVRIVVRATPPTIVTPPQSRSACLGDYVSFGVLADGADRYQWWKDGAPIAGATGATFTVSGATASDVGNYWCVVSNGCGPVTSPAASLTVLPRPTVTGPLYEPIRVCVGEPVTLAPTITNATSYRWTKDGYDIPGASGPTYTIAAASVADQGGYRVFVSNGACETEGGWWQGLEVASGPPSTAAVLSSGSVCTGGTLSVGLSSTYYWSATYQWKKDGVPIPGETLWYYTRNWATSADDGVYSCDVTNACGYAESATVTVVVSGPVTVTTAPLPATACSGETVTLTAGFSDPSRPVQWFHDGNPIAGASSPTLLLAPVTPADAGSYVCLVQSPCGAVNTPPALVTVDGSSGADPLASPLLVAPPNDSILVGSSATLFWGGASATSRWRLYLGTSDSPPLRAELPAATRSVALLLNPSTRYWWKVDALPESGSAPRETTPSWTFATGTGSGAFATVSPSFVRRWDPTPQPVSLAGTGIGAATSVGWGGPAASVGSFTRTSFSPNTLAGTVVADPSVPAGWYDTLFLPGVGNASAALVRSLAVRAFADVTEADWYFESSERVVTAGIMDSFAGAAGPEFRPGLLVTRGDMAEGLVRAHYWEAGSAVPPRPCYGYFSDVPCSHPQVLVIEWAKDLGIALGNGAGEFLPSALVTRAEMAAFLDRLLYGGDAEVPRCIPPSGWSDLASIPAWAIPYVDVLRFERITAGCSESPLLFCPLSTVGRAELATFLARTVGLSARP